MSAYLIEVQSSKQGVIYPNVIGPFDDGNAALKYRRELGLENEYSPPHGEGGYYCVHVISDERCDYTPEEWARRWTVDDDDDE